MATVKAGGTSAVHLALSKKLPGLAPKEIKSLAATIGALTAKGLKIDDAFPKGVLASPESVTISGNLDIDKLTTLGEIVKAAGSIKNVNVFPRGIPAQPDFMRVELTIGR